jgi:hypothetical protein
MKKTTLGSLNLRAVRRVLAGAALLTMSVSAAYSQSSFAPPAGDPEVLYIYLRQAHRAITKMGQAVSSNPDAADSLEKSAAARVRVSASNLKTLDRVYQSTTTSVEALDAEGRAYAQEMRAKKLPQDKAQLRARYQRRLEVFRRAANELRNGLGEADWKQLNAYIDGEFRRQVKRRPLQ